MTNTADKVGLCGKLMISTNPDITEIDSDHKDSQLCSLYAPDIYSNLSVAEVCVADIFFGLFDICFCTADGSDALPR